MLDAESIRELVGRRKRLMPEIDAALAVIRAQGKRQGYLNEIVIRCDERHKGGLPKLGTAVRLDTSRFVVHSTIKWAPRDQLKLTPWQHEAYLGVGLGDDPLDDAALVDWARRLDEWSRGATEHRRAVAAWADAVRPADHRAGRRGSRDYAMGPVQAGGGSRAGAAGDLSRHRGRWGIATSTARWCMGLSVRHVTTRRMAGAAVRTRRTPENTGTRTRESVSPLRVERSKSPRGA